MLSSTHEVNIKWVPSELSAKPRRHIGGMHNVNKRAARKSKRIIWAYYIELCWIFSENKFSVSTITEKKNTNKTACEPFRYLPGENYSNVFRPFTCSWGLTDCCVRVWLTTWKPAAYTAIIITHNEPIVACGVPSIRDIGVSKPNLCRSYDTLYWHRQAWKYEASASLRHWSNFASCK